MRIKIQVMTGNVSLLSYEELWCFLCSTAFLLMWWTAYLCWVLGKQSSAIQTSTEKHPVPSQKTVTKHLHEWKASVSANDFTLRKWDPRSLYVSECNSVGNKIQWGCTVENRWQGWVRALCLCNLTIVKLCWCNQIILGNRMYE